MKKPRSWHAMNLRDKTRYTHWYKRRVPQIRENYVRRTLNKQAARSRRLFYRAKQMPDLVRANINRYLPAWKQLPE